MPLFESAIGGIAVSLLDQAIKAGRYITKEGKNAYNKVQDEQRVIAASNAYIDNYFKRHCQIKIKVMPGLMKEPIDLESIYTAVKLLDERRDGKYAGLEELETTYRARGMRGFGAGDAERIKGMDIANSKQFLMVLGGPGIGKSTFLRKIGLETLKKEGQLHRECIPVFLELKKFREERIDIKQKIVEEFKICKFPAAEVLVDSALEQGKLLVLLDGLDEVPSQNLNHVIEQIENFVDRHDGNSFVASCRIAAPYRSSFLRFTDVTIAEFDDEQIEQFITLWFSSEKNELEPAEKFIELLFREEHKATKELTQTPLLLAYVCLVYEQYKALPIKRSKLYGQVLNIILQKWSEQKSATQDSIYAGFHPRLEKCMLGEIAYNSFKQDQLFLSRDEIVGYIVDFLSTELRAPEHLDADAVLTAIAVQQGILVEQATDEYSFSHLTLQEYLTALHIVKNQKKDELVAEHLIDEGWREVFLLVSGLMLNRSTQLLNAIDKQSRTYIAPYPKLKKLIAWAAVNKVEPSELSQRAGMLAIITAIATTIDSDRAISFDITSDRLSVVFSTCSGAIRTEATTTIDSDIARTVVSLVVEVIRIININSVASAIDTVITKASNLASDLASASASISNHHFLNAQIFELIATNLSNHRQPLPINDFSPEEWQRWSDQLQLIWLEALDLDIDDITFSEQEAEALKDYLYATELLIHCKESAIRVSRSEWEALEQRLLTIDSM